MAAQNMKPYVKLASTLVLLGGGLFSLERFGLGGLNGNGHNISLDPNVISLLILAPLVLIVAGVAVFMWGKMRRL
jgi:hypothetical protein